MEDVKKKANNVGFVQFFFVLSVVLCALLYAPRVFVHIPYLRTTADVVAVDVVDPTPTSSPAAVPGGALSSAAGGGDGNENNSSSNNNNNNAQDIEVVPHQLELDNQVGSPCSSMRDDSICCDRSNFNTDVCFMSGDVRTDAASLSLLLFPPKPAAAQQNDTAAKEQSLEEEKIRPYTRKWERFLMSRIQELRLRRPNATDKHNHEHCDVRHEAPLLVMTAGGYTGNFFHAFSDGFLPAWVTTQHLRRRVVLGVLSYNPWWAGTFGRIISGLSRYDVVDLLRDTRTHCFPGAIVGTRFHGILTVDSAKLRDNKTVADFHDFLAKAFQNDESTTGGSDGDHDHHRIGSSTNNNNKERKRPRLGIVSRRGTRMIENQAAVVNLAKSVGFDVDVLETANGMPLSAVYAAVSACDALVGVHGADLTRFLFLRPGHASFTQISPLGISPIARDCFGKPSIRMGLRYEQYEVLGHESSLRRRYKLDDVVIADPEKATKTQGWNLVAKVYLKGQNVTVDLPRFRETLVRMHEHALRLSSSSQRQQQPDDEQR